MNKNKISTTKTSLINNIGTPYNYPRKYPLAIAESGANIHIENQATSEMAPVIMPKDMTEMISDGGTMELSHVATPQLTGLIKTSRQIHIYPKMRTSPLILLGYYVIIDAPSH